VILVKRGIFKINELKKNVLKRREFKKECFSKEGNFPKMITL
jgi:hypothetical protein